MFFHLHAFTFHCSYCITLPLVLVGQFPGVYSVIATSMLSFGLMGIEEAGKIIQNPFGDDASDLVRFGGPFCRISASIIILILCVADLNFQQMPEFVFFFVLNAATRELYRADRV